MKHLLWAVVSVAGVASCTTLGPTPLATGFSARPAGRTDLALQLGSVPGYYLSQSTTDEPGATATGQVAAVFEPGKSVAGLVIGARVVSPNVDAQAEPVIGYRKSFGIDHAVAIAGFVGGTFAHGEDDKSNAEYDVKRVSGELAIEARFAPISRSFTLMGTGSVAASYSSVTGAYCSDAMGYGASCPDDGNAPNVNADLGLLTPSATVGLALDVATNRRSWFHGGRVAFNVAAARIPAITSDGITAEITDHSLAISAGLMLTVRVGAAHDAAE